MESIWRVTTNNIDGKTVYGVYRTIDPEQPEHSGNREVYDYFESREKAEQSASELNGAVPAEEDDVDRIVRLSRLDKVLTESIELNPLNPRKKIDEDKLRELAQSIEEVGILQPLVITEGSRPDKVRHLVGLLENLPASELVRLVFYAMLRPVDYDSVVFGAVYGESGE